MPHAAAHAAHAAPAGFWGAVTSTVDWCEANYVDSFYVAEMFNTVSCLAMMLVGLVGWYLHRDHELRVKLAFGSITIIGLGSIAFHGSLKASTQALDELPMLWSALIILFILIERGAVRRFGSWLPLALTGLATAVTAGYVLLEGKARFALFISTFASAEVICFLIAMPLYRRYADAPARRCFRAGVALHLAALSAWLVDTHLCHLVSDLPLGLPNPQLHAWWHMLIPSGIYLLYLVLAHVRATIMGRSPRFAFAGGLIPYVVAQPRPVVPEATPAEPLPAG